MWKYTGRKRVRLQQRFLRSPLLVLQVELERANRDGTACDLWRLEPDQPHRLWRDATVADLTVDESKESKT